jgi:hypothetical protein
MRCAICFVVVEKCFENVFLVENFSCTSEIESEMERIQKSKVTLCESAKKERRMGKEDETSFTEKKELSFAHIQGGMDGFWLTRVGEVLRGRFFHHVSN